MGSDTKRLINWRRELVDLIIGLDIPESDGFVPADCDDMLLLNVEIHG